jgi:hypothetical protein
MNAVPRLTSYRNPWHHPGSNTREDYSTDKPGIAHAGCMIYHVLPEQWDVVKAGCCITQRAGLGGAKLCAEAVVDLIAPTPDDVHERMLEKHGHL